jgi:hypothetical protein
MWFPLVTQWRAGKRLYGDAPVVVGIVDRELDALGAEALHGRGVRHVADSHPEVAGEVLAGASSRLTIPNCCRARLRASGLSPGHRPLALHLMGRPRTHVRERGKADPNWDNPPTQVSAT